MMSLRIPSWGPLSAHKMPFLQLHMVSLLHMVIQLRGLKSPSSHPCPPPSFSFYHCVGEKSVKRLRRLKLNTSVRLCPTDGASEWCHASQKKTKLQAERNEKQIREGGQRKRQKDKRLPGKSVARGCPNAPSTWHHAPFLMICCSLSMNQSGLGRGAENARRTPPRPHLETIRRVMSLFDRRES